MWHAFVFIVNVCIVVYYYYYYNSNKHLLWFTRLVFVALWRMAGKTWRLFEVLQRKLNITVSIYRWAYYINSSDVRSNSGRYQYRQSFLQKLLTLAVLFKNYWLHCLLWWNW